MDGAHAFRHIAEIHGGVAFILEAATGRLFYASPHVGELLGYSAAELAAHLDGSARESALEALCGGLPQRLARHAAGDATRRRVVRQFDVLRRDGACVPVEVASVLVEGAPGEPLRLAGLVTDISARRAEQEGRKRFASMLNHEFRTPLSTIDGAIQMLEAGAEQVPDATRQRYRKIAQAVDRLVGMLDDHLHPDRMQETQACPPARHADPLALLRDAAQYARALGRTVHVEAGVLPAALRTDPEGLRLALRVLVDNAVRYSAAERPVTLRGARTAGGIELWVEDEGSGIADDECAHIFDNGFRGRNAAGLAGSGRGLYMARTVVEALGGTVSVQNRAHCGSVFKIFLPVSPEHAS